MAGNLNEALTVAQKIGYPLMVRPSYVLGGRGMEIVHDEEMLRQYVASAVSITPDRPILIDLFLQNAIEAEADAIADGTDAYVPAVMEHIELAGVHSGDSACIIPPVNIPQKHIDTINEYTRRIAIELNVVGLMNMQYAICDDVVYVLEANPRASRTVPLVSKVCGFSMARIATQVMLGKKLSEFGQIQQMIAESYARYSASRALVYDCSLHVGPGSRQSLSAAAAKLSATQMAEYVSRCAIQVLGGYGYTREYPVEKLLRDAILLSIGGGTNEAMQKNIMKDLHDSYLD